MSILEGNSSDELDPLDLCCFQNSTLSLLVLSFDFGALLRFDPPLAAPSVGQSDRDVRILRVYVSGLVREPRCLL